VVAKNIKFVEIISSDFCLAILFVCCAGLQLAGQSNFGSGGQSECTIIVRQQTQILVSARSYTELLTHIAWWQTHV
jgi:hypothetical protein